MAITNSPPPRRRRGRPSRLRHLWSVRDKDNRISCLLCDITISRPGDFPRHFKAAHGDKAKKKEFKCDVPGCSYSANQSTNLRVHSKTHTCEKDQQCGWPGKTGPCIFSCSDPSSMNRHKKRHVVRTIKNGGSVPQEFGKYVERIGEISNAVKMNRDETPVLDLPESSDMSSSSSLDSRASSQELPDFKPGFASPQIQAATPNVFTGFSTFSIHEATHVAAIPNPPPVPQAFEQPQGQRPYYGDQWLDYLPVEYLANWPAPGQPQPQPPPVPPMEEVFDSKTLHELSILLKRSEQLKPILAKSQRPLTFNEVEGVLWWVLGIRDGIYRETSSLGSSF